MAIDLSSVARPSSTGGYATKRGALHADANKVVKLTTPGWASYALVYATQSDDLTLDSWSVDTSTLSEGDAKTTNAFTWPSTSPAGLPFQLGGAVLNIAGTSGGGYLHVMLFEEKP